MMRLMVEAAPVVCSVPKTRCPVSAAVMAARDRRQVAHFADEHHVGVLAQARRRASEKLGTSTPISRCTTIDLLVLVVILDRVFHRDDVPVEVLVDVVDHATPAWWSCPSRSGR